MSNWLWRLVAAFLLAVPASLFGQTPSSSNSSPPLPPASAPPAKVSYASVHVEGPYVALSFDDGPSATLTPRLLKILSDRHIKATFFLIGENVQAHPEIVKEEVEAGHAVGNHTWDHPALAKQPDAKVRIELQRADDAIFKASGVHPKIMRPPYGSLTKAQRLWINKEFGYKIIFWSVDPLDWKNPGPSVVASRIISETKPGSIILSHDIHAGTVEAMPQVIDTLLAKGFKFVTVPELIAMSEHPVPGKGAEPGKGTKGIAAATR